MYQKIFNCCWSGETRFLNLFRLRERCLIAALEHDWQVEKLPGQNSGDAFANSQWSISNHVPCGGLCGCAYEKWLGLQQHRYLPTSWKNLYDISIPRTEVQMEHKFDRKLGLKMVQKLVNTVRKQMNSCFPSHARCGIHFLRNSPLPP